MKRIGMVIGTVDDQFDLYKRLHADDSPEGVRIRELLKQYGFGNFSIYCTRMPDGTTCLFGYYEYSGNDFERDDAALMAEPEYREWIALTKTCQKPLPGDDGWRMMERVFFMA